ncbi:MAG: sulfotransferase family 2 domain-containing protein [Halioglobus sp.]
MNLITSIDRQWMRFNPTKREKIRSACLGPNHPLFLENKDVAVMWSAKSGCTFAVKWFFSQRGQLSEAIAHSSWIHDYRTQVYRKSDQFMAGVHRAEYGKMRYVRLVRNPFSRAVSSYLHMVRTVGDHAFHRPLNEFLGRDVEDQPGLTFVEFCEFLLATDVARCDIHYKQQAHILETSGLIAIDDVVHLESLESEWGPLIRRYKLAPASIAELSQSHHNTKRASSEQFVGDTPFLRTEEDVYPAFNAFYNEQIMEKVVAVYAEDFARYGYSKLL